MANPAVESTYYGLMAEFDSIESLLKAAEKVRDAGYKKTDAYSPAPIEGLIEALGKPHSKLPWLVLGAGLVGMVGGFGLQYWVSVIEYPINIGGRPLNSWPAFLPITFETTVLFASLTAVFATIILSGLPRPYHPVFNVPQFASASRDGFFITIESTDPKYSKDQTKAFLQGLSPRGVYEVEA